MLSSLHDRIVSLLPSKGLKDAIQKTGCHFSDRELLSIAFHYAPDFDARLSLLEELAASFEAELQAYARQIAAHQRAMLDAFQRRDACTVYELHIHETPDAYDERYLCAGYDACLKLIPLFYLQYHATETDQARYEITKRKLFSALDGEAFAEDELGSVTLLAGGRVYSVDVYSMSQVRKEQADGSFEWELPCIPDEEILFPCFTKDAAAVRFTELSGAAGYGVLLQGKENPCSECYVLPLDSDAMERRDFENIHDAHQHVLCPMVEVVPPEELPAQMRANYEAFLSYYREHPSLGFLEENTMQ